MSLYKKFLAAQFTGVTTGNLNLTGSLYQNGSPYIASQWTTTGGNVSYTTGNVVIGGDLTTGNLNLTGSLYQNGAPYIASQWTTTGADISYTSGGVIATNASNTNLTVSNATLTNATINNYIMTNLTTGNLVANNLNLGMSNVFSGSFLAGNNVASATDVTGLAFDNATVRSFVVTLTVNITITNGLNLYETFTIECTQASTGWQIAIESMGDTTNVGFTISSSGQIRYTSPDFGANWSQTVFRYTATQISNTGTFSALSSATNGSYIINSVQINSTTDAVAGVNNGVLYVLGGATVAKNLNAGSVSAGNIAAGALTTGNLVVNTAITSANVAVGALTAGNLRVPGTLTVTNISVNNLVQSSGSVTVDSITTGNINITSTQSANTFLAAPINAAGAPSFRQLRIPTVQRLTSGSGTYTTPTGTLYLRVKMIGGGGGGGGTGSIASTPGANGGITLFGPMSCTGGSGAFPLAGVGMGGTGGNAYLGGSANIYGTAIKGGNGHNSSGYGANAAWGGGAGASSPFGGAGSTKWNATANAAEPNTGSGGAGGMAAISEGYAGGGGGAGGYIDAIITSPNATYSYSVGALGAGGGKSGTGNQFDGSAGGSGVIEITEYYQ